MSDSLWPHGLQHARPPCPSPTPEACSNSCPFSQWCHPTISSSVCLLLFLPSIFLSIRVFSNESVLHVRWPNYWSFSFSISPSNEYSGLIFFRIDWLDLLTVQGYNNGSSKKQESSRKTSTSALQGSLACFSPWGHKELDMTERLNWTALLTMPKSLCGSQRTMENSSRDGNTRPPYLPSEKSVCRSRSNSKNWKWNNRLVPNRERSMSRLHIVTLFI